MSTFGYNNDDEWRIQREYSFPLPTGVHSIQDDDEDDGDANYCPEEFITAFGDTGSFFEDIGGYYVSYESKGEDGENEDNPPLAAASLHTPPSGDRRTKPKRKRTRRDPNKPKGWLTPVLMYSNANRPRVKMENVGLSFGDVVSFVFRFLLYSFGWIPSHH
jgi:hypothetical protein